MKVEFIQTMGGKDVMFIAGEIYDLPTEQAKRFIEHQICIEVIEVKEIKIVNSVVSKSVKRKGKK